MADIIIESFAEIVVTPTDGAMVLVDLPSQEINIESEQVGIPGPRGPRGEQGVAGPSGDGSDLPNLTLIFENHLI